MKHDQRNLWRKEFIYSLSLKDIRTVAKTGQGSEAGADAEDMETAAY